MINIIFIFPILQFSSSTHLHRGTGKILENDFILAKPGDKRVYKIIYMYTS